MIIYILQVLLFQMLFLGAYDLFLKKETFFQWNRFYLLASSILTYIIPFIKIKKMENVLPENLIFNDNFYFSTEPTIVINQVHQVKTLSDWFTLSHFYFLGVLIMVILFAIKLQQLIKKIRNNTIVKKENYQLVILQKYNSAFSFFNYIFLGEKIYNTEHQQILKHELIHVKQKHTLDLLFFEVQKILFWFNPFSYLFQHRISTLHEYIADANTLETKNKIHFLERLLNQTFHLEKMTFVNNYFKHSLLKKRIIMVTKNKSKQILKMKYLLVFPLFLMMLIYTSSNAQMKKTETTKVESPPSPPSPPNIEEPTSVPFSIVKELPVYPGCESLTDKKELEKCFSQNISKHISENFNLKLANNLGLSSGEKRILVQFIINKNGISQNTLVQAPHKKLEEEVKRIIKLLPKIKAGRHNNKEVKVRYKLPIVFKIEDPKKKEHIPSNTKKGL